MALFRRLAQPCRALRRCAARRWRGCASAIVWWPDQRQCRGAQHAAERQPFHHADRRRGRRGQADPALFELAMAGPGAGAAETLHIGDDPLRDVEAARRIGIARSGSIATASALARRAGAAGIGGDRPACAGWLARSGRAGSDAPEDPPMQFEVLATDGAARRGRLSFARGSGRDPGLHAGGHLRHRQGHDAGGARGHRRRDRPRQHLSPDGAARAPPSSRPTATCTASCTGSGPS
jgi:hypothetical protein